MAGLQTGERGPLVDDASAFEVFERELRQALVPLAREVRLIGEERDEHELHAPRVKRRPGATNAIDARASDGDEHHAEHVNSNDRVSHATSDGNERLATPKRMVAPDPA